MALEYFQCFAAFIVASGHLSQSSPAANLPSHPLLRTGCWYDGGPIFALRIDCRRLMNAGVSCSGDLSRWWSRMVLVRDVGD